MGRIPDEDVQRVRDATDVVTLISESVVPIGAHRLLLDCQSEKRLLKITIVLRMLCRQAILLSLIRAPERKSTSSCARTQPDGISYAVILTGKPTRIVFRRCIPETEKRIRSSNDELLQASTCSFTALQGDSGCRGKGFSYLLPTGFQACRNDYLFVRKSCASLRDGQIIVPISQIAFRRTDD